MNLEELLFEKEYKKETLCLQQAWLAHKAKKFNERDKAFENASKARPSVDLSDICMCGKGICSLHWTTSIPVSVKKCTCPDPPESPDQRCPFHGVEEL